MSLEGNPPRATETFTAQMLKKKKLNLKTMNE